jgi:hypothetical protein
LAAQNDAFSVVEDEDDLRHHDVEVYQRCLYRQRVKSSSLNNEEGAVWWDVSLKLLSNGAGVATCSCIDPSLLLCKHIHAVLIRSSEPIESFGLEFDHMRQKEKQPTDAEYSESERYDLQKRQNKKTISLELED